MIEKNNELKHVGVLGMRWGLRTRSATTTVRGKVVPKQEHARTSAKIEGISKQKISSLKKHAKTAAIVGGIIGGTVGTIAMARLMNKSSQKRAMQDALKLTKKWEAQKVAKNVIRLPAHMPRHTPKIDWSESDKIASQLKRTQGYHGLVDYTKFSPGTFSDIEAVRNMFNNGGLK